MEELIFEKVNEKLYKETLDNGIDVYLYNKKSFKNFYVTISVNFGAKYTKYKKDNKIIDIIPGSAHFLEHRVMIVGEDKNVSNKINSLGSLANAWTSKYATNYNIFGSVNIEENINILLDIFYKAKFRKNDVEEEKGIIGEEIDMNKDKLEVFMHDRIFNNMYNKSSSKYNIIGEKSDIEKIDYKYLDMLYHDFYVPSNTFIVVCGNFNNDSVMNTIKEYYSKIKLVDSKVPKRIEEKEEEKVYCEYEEISKDNYEPRCNIGYKMKKSVFGKISDQELIIYLNIILKINFTYISKLYEEYKKDNIIHSMGAYANVSDEYVSIVVEGMCDDNDLFIDKIDKDIRKLDVSKEKFEIFKKRLIKNYIVTFDNIEDVEYKITDELTRFGKIDFNDYSIIKDLSYEKCMDVLNKINYDNKCILKTVK
mgnify:FL=1